MSLPGSEPDPLPTPSVPAHRTWRRRILRAATWTSGLALGLLLAAWIFRERFVAPILIEELEAYVRSRHSVQLEIGGLDGSYFADLRLRDVEVDGSAAGSFPVRRLVGGELALEYSLLGLLRHGLAGLHGLTLGGEELVLELESSSDGEEEESSGRVPVLPERLPRCSVSFARLELDLGAAQAGRGGGKAPPCTCSGTPRGGGF